MTFALTTIFGTQEASAGFLVAQAVTVVLVGLIVKAAAGFEDASSALGFYGVYHREPWNQCIHFFGVPLILWSMFIIMAHLPLPILGKYRIKLPWISRHAITWATLVTAGYALFYLHMDLVGGILYAPFLYAMYGSAVNLREEDQRAAQKKVDDSAHWLGTGRLLQFAVAAQVFAWYIQIHPGHAILEGAKPAVLDSFGGALTSAPLFAFYEGMWLLGVFRHVGPSSCRPLLGIQLCTILRIW
jgi:uncharacterized membrane protein YGL010W